MAESPEVLAVRIRHRLRWVESLYDRRILTEVLSLRCPHCGERMVEDEYGAPVIPHPDGTGDPALATTDGTSLDGFSPESIVDWLEERGIKLIPWQRQRLFRL